LKRLRVAVLTHADLVPPASTAGLDARRIQPFKTERDVARGLRALGHDVRFIGVSDDLAPIRRCVEAWRPDVVFNLLMEFRDVGHYQGYVAGYLELLGVAATGCNPRGLLASRDKALAKKLLRHDGVPTPAFAVFGRGRVPANACGLRFPLIVKAVDEEASLGIAQASLVRDVARLRERVRFVHERVGGDALAEEYVAGRELSVGVLGGRRPRTLPVWEMWFDRLPRGSAAIATARAKWDLAYQKRIGIDSGPARRLARGLARRAAALALRSWRTLGLSGYARMDLRLAPDGGLFVLEANATPDVAADEDFARAARAAGLAYPALLQRIVELARRSPPG
jgi:D-alanine-D-alanine ligase